MLDKFTNSTLPLHFRLIRKIRMKKNHKRSFKEKMDYDEIERPNYAYCMYNAAILAKQLGYSKISVIEFGVAGGKGLLVIEKHAQEIFDELGIEFEIYGFDLEKGMPPSDDYKDILYTYSEGMFKMDKKKLELKLKKAKLVIDDVKDSSKTFFEKYNPAPIGCVFMDLDYYTSTKNSFSIFSSSNQNYLPRIHCYFDDIMLTNEFVGELCAIKEFNENNQFKKIAKIYGLHSKRVYPRPWNEQIFCFHDFKHPKYNQFIGDLQFAENTTKLE